MNYCISDIHGCSKTLTALIAQLHLTDEDTVYFLGDYVDRGPDSKGVLDIVMNLPRAVCHKGNHEDMMLYALDHPESMEASYHWGINGGKTAMASFGGKVDTKYLDFIRGLKLITELPDFYLCHAGICRDAMNTPEEMLLWDRDCIVDVGATSGRRLVCGHTPTTLDEIGELWKDKLVIDMKLFTQRNIDL